MPHESASRSDVVEKIKKRIAHYEEEAGTARYFGIDKTLDEQIIALLEAPVSERGTLQMVRDDLEAWPPERENQEQFVMPADLITLLQRTLEYYSAFDTWHGERTGGVLEGCPRGSPDIHRDGGKYAGQALLRLIKSYPLRQVKE